MKTIPSGIQTKVNTDIATQPYTLIEVDWDTGTVTYTDNDKILDASNIVSSVKFNMVGELQSATVTLDDSDGSLKQKVNTERIESRNCRIYQTYTGTAEKLLILQGKIIGEILWSEGERTLGFSVETLFESRDIGYAPQAGDIVNLDTNAVGVPWPICVGNPVHSKTVMIFRSPYFTLVAPYSNTMNVMSVTSHDARPVPSGTVTIQVDNIRFTGSFSADGTLFYVSQKNLPIYTNLHFAPRESESAGSGVAWLSGSAKIAGLYCLVMVPGTGRYMVNLCVSQSGKKVLFANNWQLWDDVEHHLINASWTILEAAPVPRISWPETYYTQVTYIPGIGHSFFLPRTSIVVAGARLSPGQFSINSGARVLVENAQPDTHIANLLPSIRVAGVYAYRQDIDDNTIFVPVPSSYYTKNTSYSISGQNTTAIMLVEPLQYRIGENWKPDLYVSLYSSLGQNIAECIKWLLLNYTNLSVDATSFEVVRKQTLAYPVNFTIYDQPSAIKICEQIAYLGRCVLHIYSDTVYIKYLSQENPTPVLTGTEGDIEYKSMSLSSTTTEDIVTKTYGKWVTDYSDRDESHMTEIVQYNTDIYGIRKRDLDVFIYNTQSLVHKSLRYWGYIDGDSWRVITLSTFLKTIGLDSFDVVAAEIDQFSTNRIRGLVKGLSQNTAEHSIQVSVLMASKMGVSVSGQPIEDNCFWIGCGAISDSDTPPADPISKIREIDYDIIGDPPGEDEEEEDEEEEIELHYEIVAPDTWVRDQLYTVTVLVKDSDGGIFGRISGRALFKITEQTDVLDLMYLDSGIPETPDLEILDNIRITSGEWSDDTVTITGGSGDQTALLLASGKLFFSGRSVPVREGSLSINIVDASYTCPSWTAQPVLVTRGVVFEIALMVGPISGSLPISLASSDPNDKLYTEDGILLTELVFDADGDHVSNVYINGGAGNDTGILTVDATSMGCDLISSETFSIVGAGIRHFEHQIEFEDEFTGTAYQLLLSKTGEISSGSFALEVQIVFAGTETVATDWGGWVNLELLTDPEVTPGPIWLDAGPGAVLSDTHAIIHVTDGVWSYATASITPAVDPTTHCIEAVAVEHEELNHKVCDLVPYSITVDLDLEGVPYSTDVDFTPTPDDTSPMALTSPQATPFTIIYTSEPAEVQIIAPEELPEDSGYFKEWKTAEGSHLGYSNTLVINIPAIYDVIGHYMDSLPESVVVTFTGSIWSDHGEFTGGTYQANWDGTGWVYSTFLGYISVKPIVGGYNTRISGGFWPYTDTVDLQNNVLYGNYTEVTRWHWPDSSWPEPTVDNVVVSP